MKIIRVHCMNSVQAFVLPKGLRQKIALWQRGWRPANLMYVAIPWWTKPSRVLKTR